MAGELDDLMRRLKLDVTGLSNRLLETFASRIVGGAIVSTTIPDGQASVLVRHGLGLAAAGALVIAAESAVVVDPVTEQPTITVRRAVANAGAASWQSIYDADLATVPNTSMSAAGSYSLLDATWWAKGALWASGTADAVNGSGIRLAGAEFTAGNNWRTANSGLRINFLPFSQFSDWNADLPTWVALRFSGAMAGSQNRYPVAGMLGAAADANGLTASEYAQAASIQFYTQLLENNTNWIGVGSNPQEVLVSVPASAGMSDYDDFQFGLLRGMQGAYTPGASLWTGSTTAPGTSAQNITGQLTGLKAQELANLGFFFTLHGPTNGLATSAILNKLTIYQPKTSASSNSGDVNVKLWVF